MASPPFCAKTHRRAANPPEIPCETTTSASAGMRCSTRDNTLAACGETVSQCDAVRGVHTTLHPMAFRVASATTTTETVRTHGRRDDAHAAQTTTDPTATNMYTGKLWKLGTMNWLLLRKAFSTSTTAGTPTVHAEAMPRMPAGERFATMSTRWRASAATARHGRVTRASRSATSPAPAPVAWAPSR